MPMPRHATAMQHAHHLLRSDPSLPSSQAFDRPLQTKLPTRSNSAYRRADTQKKQGHADRRYAGPRRTTHSTPTTNLHDCSCSCSAQKVCICRIGKAVSNPEQHYQEDHLRSGCRNSVAATRKQGSGFAACSRAALLSQDPVDTVSVLETVPKYLTSIPSTSPPSSSEVVRLCRSPSPPSMGLAQGKSGGEKG
jgi:hypothetical protein